MHECNIFWSGLVGLLREQGYTQAALAKETGVDQATICRIADGRAPEPRFGVAIALLNLAGGLGAVRARGLVLPEAIVKGLGDVGQGGAAQQEAAHA